MIRWIPTFCFLDSTTVDSNIVFACICLNAFALHFLRSSGFPRCEDLHSSCANGVGLGDVSLRFHGIGNRIDKSLLTAQQIEVCNGLGVTRFHVYGMLDRGLAALDTR